MNGMYKVAMIILLIGGINWGLVGIFNFDLFAAILGDMSALSRLIYVIVGVSAIYLGIQWKMVQQRGGLAPTGV